MCINIDLHYDNMQLYICKKRERERYMTCATFIINDSNESTVILQRKTELRVIINIQIYMSVLNIKSGIKINLVRWSIQWRIEKQKRKIKNVRKKFIAYT